MSGTLFRYLLHLNRGAHPISGKILGCLNLLRRSSKHRMYPTWRWEILWRFLEGDLLKVSAPFFWSFFPRDLKWPWSEVESEIENSKRKCCNHDSRRNCTCSLIGWIQHSKPNHIFGKKSRSMFFHVTDLSGCSETVYLLIVLWSRRWKSIQWHPYIYS